MATQLTTTREERGEQIAQHNGEVKRIEENFYTVQSQSGNGEYAITKVDHEWICECPDNKFRQVKCKHIYAVEFSQTIRAEVSITRIEPLSTLTECIYCGSKNLKKKGIRKNKSGNIQKYECHDCHKYFTYNIGFEHMKHNPKAVTTAMQLYFSGESLRNTTKALELMGVKVSYRTILNWIKKYTRLMQTYTESIVPKVGDTWRADEIYIKVRGNMKYLFSMMDDETRFWIAQEVAETKEKHDARTLFHRAKRLMGKQPKKLITDGLYAYSIANEQVFCQSENPKEHTEHIRKITFKGKVHNNNKMERMNGEIRDREKTMRGLKRRRTPILAGMQIYHNFVRPHMALNGKTPAEACGIKVEGENKWLTLIQNASKRTNIQKP
jgi:putative transposase